MVAPAQFIEGWLGFGGRDRANGLDHPRLHAVELVAADLLVGLHRVEPLFRLLGGFGLLAFGVGLVERFACPFAQRLAVLGIEAHQRLPLVLRKPQFLELRAATVKRSLVAFPDSVLGKRPVAFGRASRVGSILSFSATFVW